jgi:hypothetical protein
MRKPPSRLEFEIIYWALVAQIVLLVIGSGWMIVRVMTH